MRATRYFDVLNRRIYVASRPLGEHAEKPVRPVSLLWLLFLIGLLVIAFHELTYRQTGGDEFPVLHIISHAGADMLMLLGVLICAARLAQRAAERGVK